VSTGSNTRAWCCKQGHEWQTKVNSRASWVMLPRPSETAAHTDPAAHMVSMSTPRPPKPGQSLVELFPLVAAQWHPTRNGDRTPDQVHAGTDAKTWWRCEDGHEWEAPVSRRTRQSSGCPVCTGRRVLTGFNDLTTASPDTAKQWHPTRNGDLTPDRVTAGSGKKVWWRCVQGHEWEATINSRTSGGNGCPVHTRQKLLAGYNDLGTRFPAVAKQWHLTRNADLTPPDRVLVGTNAKAWWRCELGHEWRSAVRSRTTKGYGCPVHAGRTVLAGYNDLATRFPAIAKQWHPTRNADRTPDQVTAGHHAKVWWKCPSGHEWQAAVYSRTSGGHGCAVCSRR